MIVCGIKRILKILLRGSKQNLVFYSLAQTISQPSLHPGPSHLFVNPEHLKITFYEVANSAKVLDGSSQVTPSQISSARIGSFFFLQNSSSSSLQSQCQQVPRGLDGSFNKMNFVLSSTRLQISAKSAFHPFSAFKWNNLIYIPIEFAITVLKGNPGDGNKQLSPSSANNIIVAHKAKLPPAVMNTLSCVMLKLGALNLLATASLAQANP